MTLLTPSKCGAAALAVIFWSHSAFADQITDQNDALDLLRDENWAEAASAFDRVVAANPYRGETFYYLGKAHERLGDCKTAAPYYSRALELGVNGRTPGMRRVHVEAAACATQLGRYDEAVALLSTARARYMFSDFDALADDARFSALADRSAFVELSGGRDWSGVARDDGWRADLAAFVDLVLRRHPDPFHSVDEARWREAAAETDRDIPHMSDHQVIGAFMRLAGMIGDGHTVVYPPFGGPRAVHLIPIWPYAFGDDWRIVAAAPGHADLVGARIVSIEGVPMDEAVRRIAERLPRDNDQTSKWLVSVALQLAETGALMFGSENPSCLPMTVEPASGEIRDICLEGADIDRDPQSRWTPDGWPSIAAADAPLWLSDTASDRRSVHIADLSALYIQLNQVQAVDDLSLADFAANALRQFDETGARHLILDLRHNNGGNGYLNWGFVRELVRHEKLDEADALFVIVGRRTFSAAMLLASMLEFHVQPIFVGEPTGSRPQFYGEDATFELPYSGLQGSISSRRFQNRFISDDDRPWIAPHLAAELTVEDLRAGRDPAMSAIRDYLGGRTGERH